MTCNPTEPKPARALLRYFGGKWALAPWILPHLPSHRVYVEPFGGAASVLLRKSRSSVEVYNDLDEEIVGILRCVQDPNTCQQLIRKLRRTAYSRKEYEAAWQSKTDCPIERARRAIVRSYQSFHHETLFNQRQTPFDCIKHRTSSKGCKAREWSRYPRHLVSICQRLSGVLIECLPASEVIRLQDGLDTLFFVDPPYVPSSRCRNGRYRHEMNEAEHIALLEQLRGVKGKVVLAGYPSVLYDQHLHDWQRLERKHHALRSQKPRTEVLWLSPNAQK